MIYRVTNNSFVITDNSFFLSKNLHIKLAEKDPFSTFNQSSSSYQVELAINLIEI